MQFPPVCHQLVNMQIGDFNSLYIQISIFVFCFFGKKVSITSLNPSPTSNMMLSMCSQIWMVRLETGRRGEERGEGGGSGGGGIRTLHLVTIGSTVKFYK